jgi:hypothetical protein
MAAPVPVLCIEKWTLLRAFATAVSNYNRMQSAQLAAVLRGEDFQFQAQIEEAAHERDQLKYAILAHRESHGC